MASVHFVEHVACAQQLDEDTTGGLKFERRAPEGPAPAPTPDRLGVRSSLVEDEAETGKGKRPPRCIGAHLVLEHPSAPASDGGGYLPGRRL
jgi:hypothetical protein